MVNNLWNNIEQMGCYKNNPELYQNHILEQYKIYVEMSDKISSRRNLTNVFFLTLNTTILSLFGFLPEIIKLITPKWLMIFPLSGFLLFCVVWWWIICSYRNLNSAKHKIIGLLEKKLPASPYWSAEWKELGYGKDVKKYFPISVLENFIPIVFGLIYILTIGYFLLGAK